ncbi:4,5-9,10-diseco-3-hydroxy-5,9,17-trioxoandrosta-1(10),2-diene-4-oate hydrolase [Actinomycetospora sp. NBRC 106375]|uniref:alpha/beta fold hydrolase n=1 Tax=Actinomycetospora sp. NBRC 106375 TaxID=3032207 RepID=UPI0024A2AA2B|nr:alpha/beta hydrolase [Actinomycetospora sp. NBRC 106375]GLZ47736.1 4,5-9,10-diseco-3-hydroxy-5,9,17-trioxoandrosta-1(10),2-diene-4-oate hydrolase [Actinomycetospora sp. NBRC 106375]
MATRTALLSHGRRGAVGGPVTVVLHGGGPGCHAASDFAAVMDARPGRSWLWADLPGYGLSPAASGPRLGAAARALVDLLDGLGIERADVLAQSYGGSVTLLAASGAPDRFRRLVLVGSTPTPAPGGVPDLLDPELGARLRAAYAGDGRPSAGRMRELIGQAEWHDRSRVPDALVDARFRSDQSAAGAPGTPEDLGDRLAHVTAPVDLVWGRHDPFAGPAYAAALADALPRADLTVLHATAHHPQSERPDAVAAIVDAHLRSSS